MQNKHPDPYATLGIKPGASESEIKKAYRKLCKIHHPDKAGGSSEEFRKISDAYEMLTNPYDKRNIGEKRANPAGFDPWFSFFVNTAANAHAKQRVRQLDIRLSMDIPVNVAFEGGFVDIEYVRNSYSGDSVHGERVKSRLQIPKRMANGFGVKVSGGGHKEESRVGDLIVFMGYPAVGENYLVDRIGNIKCRVKVPWFSSLSGETVKISPFGKGEKISVQLDKNAGNVHSYTLKGEGMKPYWEGMKQTGDLILEVISVLPANMKEEDEKIVSEILRKYATLDL